MSKQAKCKKDLSVSINSVKSTYTYVAGNTYPYFKDGNSVVISDCRNETFHRLNLSVFNEYFD